MSAANIIKTDDAVYLFTDGASYHADGALGAVGQKVAVLAHLNAAITCRGPAAFLDGFTQALNTAYASFDELVESFALAVSNVYAVDASLWAYCATGPDVEVFLAGWSESRDRPESYVVKSHDRDGAAWALIPLGPLAIAPYDVDLHERLARLDPSDNVIDIGVSLMNQQRRVRGQHGGAGPAVVGVGGFCQVTAVTTAGVWTSVVKRWDDRIGEPLGKAA